MVTAPLSSAWMTYKYKPMSCHQGVVPVQEVECPTLAKGYNLHTRRSSHSLGVQQLRSGTVLQASVPTSVRVKTSSMIIEIALNHLDQWIPSCVTERQQNIHVGNEIERVETPVPC